MVTIKEQMDVGHGVWICGGLKERLGRGQDLVITEQELSLGRGYEDAVLGRHKRVTFRAAWTKGMGGDANGQKARIIGQIGRCLLVLTGPAQALRPVIAGQDPIPGPQGLDRARTIGGVDQAFLR